MDMRKRVGNVSVRFARQLLVEQETSKKEYKKH